MKIDLEAKTKILYFIKLFTSYSFLKEIYELNKAFVDAFEKQLRNPKDFLLINDYDQRRHEKELIMYLYVLDIEEKALPILLNNKYKKTAYNDFISEDIYSTIFGRYGDERALEEDTFYKSLGMQGRDSGWMFQNVHRHHIKKICIANEFLTFLKITLSDQRYEYFMPNYPNLYLKWSYESFNKFMYWEFIKNGKISNNHVESKGGIEYEIYSGHEIKISGIYEPWFEKPVYEKLTQDLNYNIYVGCPNYFLNGTIATQYKLETTEDWYDVNWRLIWEDTRYLDGTIPQEELAYKFNLDITTSSNIPENNHEKLSVRAGEKVPQFGYWYTTAKKNSRQYFKQGDIFPNFESDWGEVYWYFDAEE